MMPLIGRPLTSGESGFQGAISRCPAHSVRFFKLQTGWPPANTVMGFRVLGLGGRRNHEEIVCEERSFQSSTPSFLSPPSDELQSKLLNGGYIRDYIGDYYRGY